MEINIFSPKNVNKENSKDDMTEIYNIEVKLLAITGPISATAASPEENESHLTDPEELIEYAGRLCWDSTDKLGTTSDRIQKWIEMGHESVIEHASATFYIRASRVLTHELVRHRTASYSQRSQRYVREIEPQYITPPELNAATPDAPPIFESAMQHAWSSYRQLLNLGIKPEIARYVLPNACESQIVMTMNFRELRHFIKLRSDRRSLPEMRAVAGRIREIMKTQAPKSFEDI
jgi:thymidylate synthase (FAD)